MLLDSFFVTALFTLIAGSITFLLRFFWPDVEIPENRGLLYGLGWFLWAVAYLWASVTIFGKTVGKLILGVRVVRSDGQVVVAGRNAFVRAITFPLSLAVFGLGLLGVVFGPERRAWHDHFAKTAVVYDWGSRTAAMPTPLAAFLERRGEA